MSLNKLTEKTDLIVFRVCYLLIEIFTALILLRNNYLPKLPVSGFLERLTLARTKKN